MAQSKPFVLRLAGLLVCMALFICLPVGCQEAGRDAALAFDLAQSPATLDPQIGNDAATRLVLANVMEGLTRLDAQGEVQLSALTQSYTRSQDGKTYRFLLKKGLTWSDASPLTADDFVFAFQRIFTADTQSYATGQFSFLVNAKQVLAGKAKPEKLGVFVDDQGWLTFQLTEDRPEFLRLLAEPAALPCPRDFFYEAKGRYGLERKKMLYNGPFAVQYWLDDEYLHLVRNDKYAGEAALPLSVSLTIVPEEDQRFERFTQGKTTACAATKEQVDTLPQNKFQARQYADTVWCLAFRLDNKTLKNPLVRKALAACHNRETMQAATDDYHKQTDHILPPTVTESRPQEQPVAYAPKQANGWFAAWLQETGQSKLTDLTLLLPQEGRHRTLVAALQQEWQMQLGLFVNLELEPTEVYEQRLASGDFALALMPVRAEANSALTCLEQFAKSAGQNPMGFADQSFDATLLKAANSDAKGRQAALDQCYDKLVQTGCLLPLYTQASVYLTQKGVGGLTLSPFGDRILFAQVRVA